MTRKLIIGIAIVALACLSLAVIKWRADAPIRDWESTARAMVGQSEADFIKKLGPPRHTVSSATLAGRTVDYPWKDMNYVPVPDHPVRNKVLLYSKLNVALYVYVDEKGLIEYIAMAGT
jgi:hypothetical protein